MGLVTGNTFSVTLNNPTSQKQSVELFRQGYAPSTQFLVSSSRCAFYDNTDYSKFFDPATNTVTTTTDIVISANFTPFASSGSVTAGEPIISLQERLNTSWAGKPANGKILLYLNEDDKFTVEVYGVSWPVVGNFSTINAIVGGVPTAYSELITSSTQKTATINPFTAATITEDSVSYAELLATQTGSPMNILAIDIDTTNDNQFNNPIVYKRIDSNGNTSQKSALSVIDPYQYQTKHIVNIPVEGLMFDGNCEFDYTLDPFTTAKITFRYVNLAESMLFGTAIRQQIADQYRQAQEDMINLSNGLKKTLKL